MSPSIPFYSSLLRSIKAIIPMVECKDPADIGLCSCLLSVIHVYFSKGDILTKVLKLACSHRLLFCTTQQELLSLTQTAA